MVLMDMLYDQIIHLDASSTDHWHYSEISSLEFTFLIHSKMASGNNQLSQKITDQECIKKR